MWRESGEEAAGGADVDDAAALLGAAKARSAVSIAIYIERSVFIFKALDAIVCQVDASIVLCVGMKDPAY